MISFILINRQIGRAQTYVFLGQFFLPVGLRVNDLAVLDSNIGFH